MRHHTATLVSNPSEPPTDLVDACLTGNCVLYVGAGLSACVGFPVWHQFVQRLLDWAEGIGQMDATFSASLREAAAGGMNDLVVDSILGRLADGGQTRELHRFLEDTFLDPAARN